MNDSMIPQNIQSGLAILKSKSANKRLSMISEILTENFQTPINYIADALAVDIKIVENDLILLIERNDPLAIKHRDFFINAKNKQKAVKNLILQNQFSSDSELASMAGLTEDEYRETLIQVREASKNGDDSINTVAKRQALVNDYIAKHPGKPLVFIADQMGVSLDRLLQDKQLMSDPQYTDIQEYYTKQGIIQSLGNDIKRCEELRNLCTTGDARAGTRWQEEKTKAIRVYAELTGASKKKLEINMAGERTREERDAAVAAALKSHLEEEFNENEPV